MYNNFKPIKQQFKIQSVGYPFRRYLTGDYIFDGEYHDFIELVYIDSGIIELLEEEKIYIMGRGDIIFHAPMEFHKVKSIKNTSPYIFNLSFKIDGKVPSELFDGIYKLDEGRRRKFLDLFDAAYRYIKGETSDAYISQDVATGLSSFLTDVCRNCKNDNVAYTDSGALIYKKIVETMKREVHSNLSLCDISQLNNISMSYLKKLFSKYCDTSPKEYYRKMRLRECIKMLAENIAISEISEKMNFSYPNHFTEFFKGQTGLTPSEYRNKLPEYKLFNEQRIYVGRKSEE